MDKAPHLETGQNNFEQLLKRVNVWAQEQSRVAIEAGTLLSKEESGLAKMVGVEHPELVRILEVDVIPVPSDIELKTMAEATGLFSPDIAGITFNYGIYIKKGHRKNHLVSHELRHVYQYEKAGSIQNFLNAYILQLLSVGYANAPLELDAQNHERS